MPYNGIGLGSPDLGFIDPIAGMFGMNWGAIATFNVFNAAGTTQIGTGELLLFSPETGAYDPATGVAASQTFEPVPATLLLRGNGGAAAIAGITINNKNVVNTGRSAAGAIGGTFASNSVPDLTIGLPDLLGGGTISANLAGTVQFTTPSITAAYPVITAGTVQIDFNVTLLPTSTFQLLKSSHAIGPWVQDTSAVLTTNTPGSSYRFTTTTGGTPAQFYRIVGM